MKKFFPLAVTVLLCLGPVPSFAGDVIDRIVATVNGHAILQSDWEEAISYEAFIEGRPVNRLTAEDRKASLDRLIDQELLREQLHATASSQPEQQQVMQRVQEIRKLYPDCETEQGWQATLRRHGLNQQELESRLAQQFELMRLVDARLRPGVQIDARSIEIYYQETLVPELRKAGARQLPLAEVAPKVREVLTQQKINDLLVSWLRNLRAESQIRNRSEALAPAGAPR
jgi:SurA N-terminal domain